MSYTFDEYSTPKETILEALHECRVLRVSVNDLGQLELRESCDGCFSAKLDKSQAKQLLRELKMLIGKMERC